MSDRRESEGRVRRGAVERPALWRLPLLAFLVISAVCLAYLDGRLSREYRRSAADLAVHADALVESAIARHAALLRTLEQVLASAGSASARRQIVENFGAATLELYPEVVALYHLDERGEARYAFPADTAADTIAAASHLLRPESAEAIERARRLGRPAATSVIELGEDTLGVIIYEPVHVRGSVTGYVAAAIGTERLLGSLFAAEFGGRFGYRISDSAGHVLAASPDYPALTSDSVSRRVDLPGGRAWQLAIPIGVFEPRAARVAMWLVGTTLLFVVFLLVLREDARAERIAMHSFNLELLSRDLLDANVRLEERAQQVTQANQAKSRFLANVSHELRTPINAIVGYNDLALSGLYGEVPPQLRGSHERIRNAAEHLLRVVNDVLDLSKIEVGRMDVEWGEVDLESVLESVMSVVEQVAEAKGVRVDLVLARDLPPLTTDRRHVRQIVLNLVTNAIKFTDHGAISLVARRSDGSGRPEVHVAVEDTGIGIPEADRERIFEEFEQVRPGGRGDSIVRGTGLGLAVSRKLARLLGGDVRVESQLGQGSTFTLVLPIEAPHAAPATGSGSDESPAAVAAGAAPGAGPRP